MAEPERGWYPDPADASLLRWWDGTGWGEPTRPANVEGTTEAFADPTPPRPASAAETTPLSHAAPVAAPPGGSAWGASVLAPPGTAVLAPPMATSNLPPSQPPERPARRRPRRGPSVVLVLALALVLVAGGAAAYVLTRPSAEEEALEVLRGPATVVRTPSGRVRLELPGPCIGITTAELSAPGGSWGGLAASVGAQAIACGSDADRGSEVVDAFAREGTGRFPPVAVLTLDRVSSMAPGVDASATAELLARQLAELDEAADDGGGTARYDVERAELAATDRGTAAAFISRGPVGPRAVRKGRVQFIGETVVVVIVSTPTGQEALADRVLDRAMRTVQVS